MVTDAVAKRLVNKHLPNLLKELGISHWEIIVDIAELEDGILGCCYTKPKYDYSHIILDPSSHDNEQHLIDTLLHECLHILHSPFDMAMDGIKRVLQELPEGQGSPALALFEELWSVSEELTVKNLERAYRILKKNR